MDDPYWEAPAPYSLPFDSDATAHCRLADNASHQQDVAPHLPASPEHHSLPDNREHPHAHANSSSYQCRWAGCSVLLDNGSVAGVKRHLRAAHIHTTGWADCSSGVRNRCLWEHDGTVCGRPLDVKSFAKHIASVHLKSTAAKCNDCGIVIGRADSLTRHRRDHCTARRGYEDFEHAAAHFFSPLITCSNYVTYGGETSMILSTDI